MYFQQLALTIGRANSRQRPSSAAAAAAAATVRPNWNNAQSIIPADRAQPVFAESRSESAAHPRRRYFSALLLANPSFVTVVL